MKNMALHKVDVRGLVQNIDVNGPVLARLSVGVDGSVECVEILAPNHPVVVAAVTDALMQWTFKPLQKGGAGRYLGSLAFQFCNVACPEDRVSVSLLN